MGQTTTVPISSNTTQNDDDCINFLMVLAFEDQPMDFFINLRTVNDIPPIQYWVDYMPYKKNNISTTTTIVEELCLPKSGCYLLQAVDNGKIGWNPTTDTTQADTNDNNLTRAFVISYDTNVIGTYDSNVPDSCFSVQWYQFGYTCNLDVVTDNENEATNIETDSISSILSIYQGSIPCSNTFDGTDTTNNEANDKGTSPPKSDTITIKGFDVTITIKVPSSNTSENATNATMTNISDAPIPSSNNAAPSTSPIMVNAIESSFPSMVPSIVPSPSLSSNAPTQMNITSTSPSSVPSIVPSQFLSANTTIQTTNISSTSPSSVPSNTPVLEPGTNSIPSISQLSSDMPSVFESSFTSDVPSTIPSIIPTVQCVDFHFIVQTDDHPEDMVLTLVATNEHGSDDDVVIWDHIRPWMNNNNGSNTTNTTTFVHQIVNQTTCIYSDECYTFTVEDLAQDGLTQSTPIDSIQTGNTNATTPPTLLGYYTLMLENDRIISYYDSTLHGCYQRKVYKFGLSLSCAMTETTVPTDQSCPQVRRRR